MRISLKPFPGLFVVLLMCHLAQAQSTGILIHLQTEHMSNPLGIDNPAPRFTWQLNDSRRGAGQTAYRILVNADSSALAKGTGTEWDAGWQAGSSTLITYAGRKLQPFTRYYWRVMAMGRDHHVIMSGNIAWFETGMMQISNWRGSWISDSNDITIKRAPYFRKVFYAAKRIRTARVYVAAAGLYELYLNGQKIGDHRLDPMYTRFDRRILYVSYDITASLREGENALGVLLGNGWYNLQSTAVWDFHKAPWRARPAFCLDLHLTYEDGSTEIITSGKDWKTTLSPIISNSIYTAEHYDARLEKTGWNTVNYVDTAWLPVIYRQAPAKVIAAQVMYPIKNVEEIPAVSMQKLGDSTYVFNLGRNIAGVSKLKVQGSAGTVIHLRHTERLYANGHTDMSNIDIHYRPTGPDDPFQTDIITLKGGGEEVFMPHFNYKGFQYVEVTSSRPLGLTKESLTGYFMHSAVPPSGDIRSSDPLIDKIWRATNNSYLSNLFGYPTDCPQREKNGWTGDAQIAVETGLYNFDAGTIYEKWMADHRDEQQPNGVLPSIIPSNGWGYEWGNGPDWTSTIAIIPWNLYLFYGDKKPLADSYEAMKLYVEHIAQIYPSGLTSWGLGDWVPVKSVTPVELTSSCYYYADVNILSNTAALLGHAEDAKKYRSLALKIKVAFNQKYLNAGTGVYADGTQTALSAPLYWGLVPDAERTRVAANLAHRVELDNFHLDVGLLGQKAVLNALSENGYAAVAYKIASQKTFPSWGWWIENGATTLYENWNIDSKNDISLNHIMFGEIGAWLYKGLAGIKPDPLNPGFKNILIEPHFVDELEHFEGTHEGPYGKITSRWDREGKKILYSLIIPANSTATVILPEIKGSKVYLNNEVIPNRVIHLVSGTYRFTLL